MKNKNIRNACLAVWRMVVDARQPVQLRDLAILTKDLGCPSQVFEL